MQLRAVKKPKIKAFDFGLKNPTEQSTPRKNSTKEQEEKEILLSSNENSNLTKENEIKAKHKLRNKPNNYQGKYKKMNSGKYLYKLSNSVKRPVMSKKKQLRFLPIELVHTFKKILIKLNKKEVEESMLNKKKKREEVDEGVTKQKGVVEGMQENKKKGNIKQQSSNQFKQMENINEYELPQQYTIKKNPYELYYQPNMENMKSQGMTMDNQHLFYRMNNDFMRLIQMPEYYYQGLYPQQLQLEQEPKPKSESIFNLISDKENLNRINKIANEGVNHIVAAFYIKSIQQSRNSAKNNDNLNSNIVRRSSVLVNSVNLDEKRENDENSPKIQSSNKLEEKAINQYTRLIPSPKSKPQGGESIKSNTFDFNINNMMIFNDKHSPSVNEFTANQLNTVNNVMKKIKENKIREIIDNDDYQSKK